MPFEFNNSIIQLMGNTNAKQYEKLLSFYHHMHCELNNSLTQFMGDNQ